MTITPTTKTREKSSASTVAGPSAWGKKCECSSTGLIRSKRNYSSPCGKKLKSRANGVDVIRSLQAWRSRDCIKHLPAHWCRISESTPSAGSLSFADSFLVGTWLSLVEHSLGVRGVGSSNLPVPTNSFASYVSETCGYVSYTFELETISKSDNAR